MKKILSTLVMCLILGVSSVWADSTTDKNSITIKATASPASGGTVLVETKTANQGSSISVAFTSWSWNGFVSDPNGAGVTSQHTGKSRYYEWFYWALGTKTASKTTGIYYRVNAYPNQGYYFQKWTGLVNVTTSYTDENGEETVESTENPYQPDGDTYLVHKKAKTYYYNTDKTYSITAYFKPVTVDAMTIDGEAITSKTLNSTDKNGYKETTIVFTTAHADNMNDFVSDNVVLSGDSRFTIQSSTLSGNTVTVVVRFKDDDRHVVDGTLPKASVTLTSKGDNSSTKTATITATSDLTPYFIVSPSPICDLTQNDPVEDENEVSAKLTTIATTGYTKVVSLASWNATFTDPVAAAQLGFSIDKGTTYSPTVKFTPTQASINKANVTTEVCITSTYEDNSNPQKTLTHKQCVTISVDAGKIFTINTVSDAVMDFDIVDYSETNSPVEKTFPVYTTMKLSDFTITENLNGITYATNVVGQGSATDSIVVTAQSNLVPNTYVSRIDFAETGDDLHASLTVNVPIKLAKPVVKATVGLGQKIQLDWQDVYGATSYIVKSGETILATITPEGGVLESAYAVTNIAGRLLNTGVEYSFTVTAIYEPNAFGNRTSDEVTATPTAPSTITSPADLDIWTGTEKTGSYPYSAKRIVDLSAAFNKGAAAFNKLYIFGLTSGDANNNITTPTATTNSNAVTPCYIYVKDGENYRLSTTIPNVNVADKPAEFTINDNNASIYITGYAPFASCGYQYSENGVFLFTNNVDVYLDNAQIYARPKSKEGNIVTKHTYKVHSIEEAANLANGEEFDLDYKALMNLKLKADIYTQGSGSVFCFQPKNRDITPNIHLRGENVLDSREGVYIHVDINLYLQMKNQGVQMSAPIQILHNKNTSSRTTTLTIDDIWDKSNPNIRTNGILNLAKADVRPAPTIDLGNENTTLNINGGQIFLSNSFNSSESYIVSYAISYRKKSFTMGEHGASIVGLGDDQPGGTVNFNDGTITCKPLTDDIVNSTLGKTLFHNKESMKCPKNTVINGGTFNCNVLSCAETESKGSSPKNKYGKLLCLVDIPVESIKEPNLAVLNANWMSDALANDLTNTTDLGYYGIKSMKPTVLVEGGEEKLWVHMMLPSDLICFKEEVTTPWIVCFPETTVKSKAEGMDEISTTVSGEKEVIYSANEDEGLTRVYKTSRLFYGQIDDILINSMQGYTPPGDITSIEFANKNGEIINNDAYVIYDKIYMLMPVIANEWKLFAPPFDVSNIYVIESYPEAELINDFGEDTFDKKNNPIKKIISPEAIQNARNAQSHRMIDMCYQLIASIEIQDKHADFWSNHTSYPAMGSLYSVSEYMQAWMNKYILRDQNGQIIDASEKPIIDQLYHYKSNDNGYPKPMTRWDANFYLYKAEGNEWEINENGLQTNWVEVEDISLPRNFAGNNNVIMNKGDVYVMCFPYSINNSDKHDYTKVWDYWTGKYILLEGYPTQMVDSDGDKKPDTKGQMIAGYDFDWNGESLRNTIFAPFEPEELAAVLRGNSTFGIQEVNHDNIFVIYGNGNHSYLENFDHNAFVNYSVVTLTPGEGFMLANGMSDSSSKLARRITSINPRTGAVTYRDETTTSVPTIGGNKQMMVYNIEGGVGIVPVVAQQVSIYNAAGQLITSQYLTDEVHIPLPSGIYLITGVNDQFKAVVK